jgi:hypothetical protein
LELFDHDCQGRTITPAVAIHPPYSIRSSGKFDKAIFAVASLKSRLQDMTVETMLAVKVAWTIVSG